MRSVSILIPNRNSFEAVQLCIESIRLHTEYPNYKIVVYDDYSVYPQDGTMQPNPVDLPYLRACAEKGWITLIEGKEHKRHGGALNILVNEVCDTDYAVVCDCDIWIKARGWLADLIRFAERDPKILIVCNQKRAGYTIQGYRSGMFTLWFGLINMRAYRDGMQVDWNVRFGDRREEPYKSEVAHLHPAEQNATFQMYLEKRGWKREKFDPNKVCNDPGSMLYLKWKYDNPKGYQAVHVPFHIEAKYKHFSHISLLPYPSPLTDKSGQAWARREAIMSEIKQELTMIRRR